MLREALRRMFLVVVISMVPTMCARDIGMLQVYELAVFDFYTQLRPERPQQNDRFVIIDIDGTDASSSPIEPEFEQQLVTLIQKVQQGNPSVIGLNTDLSSSITTESEKIHALSQGIPNFITAHQFFLSSQSPVDSLAPKQTNQKVEAFVNIIQDADGYSRRALLLAEGKGEIPIPSFGLALAQSYLQQSPSNYSSLQNLAAITEQSFKSNPGAYFLNTMGAHQVMLSYQGKSPRFQYLAAQDIIAGTVSPTAFHDQIVLLNVIFSHEEEFSTPYRDTQSRVEIHATLANQLIRSALGQNTLIKAAPTYIEWLWVGVWVITTKAIFLQSQFQYIKKFPININIQISAAWLILAGITYIAFLHGYWISCFIAFAAATKSSVLGLCYGYLDSLKTNKKLLEQQSLARKQAMEDAFTQIHNGPLQTLSALSKEIEIRKISSSQVFDHLVQLNTEIREIGQHLIDSSHLGLGDSSPNSSLLSPEILRLGNGSYLDLSQPLHQLLYEVYTLTLTRSFPHFSRIQIKARNFEPIADIHLSLELKRDLCLWLEEAICNVGKYAEGATRLVATGTESNGIYQLTVKDNGVGLCSQKHGEGSKYSQKLATRLQGTWRREALPNRGTVCELSWKPSNT